MSNETNIDPVSNKWNIRQGDRYVTLDNTGSHTVSRITEVGDVEFTDGEFEAIFESVDHLYRLYYGLVPGDVYETVGVAGKHIYRVVDVDENGRVSYTVDDREVQKGLHTVDFNSVSLRRIARDPIVPQTEETVEDEESEEGEATFTLEIIVNSGGYTSTETLYFLTEEEALKHYHSFTDLAIEGTDEDNEDDFSTVEVIIYGPDDELVLTFALSANEE